MKIYKFYYSLEARSEKQARKKLRADFEQAMTKGLFEEVFDVEIVEEQSLLEKIFEKIDVPMEEL